MRTECKTELNLKIMDHQYVAVAHCVLWMVSSRFLLLFWRRKIRNTSKIPHYPLYPTVPDCQCPSMRNPGRVQANWISPRLHWELQLQRLTVLEWHWVLHSGSSSETWPTLGNTWKDLWFFSPSFTSIHLILFPTGVAVSSRCCPPLCGWFCL